jgi:hypothetical protein
MQTISCPRCAVRLGCPTPAPPALRCPGCNTTFSPGGATPPAAVPAVPAPRPRPQPQSKQWLVVLWILGAVGSGVGLALLAMMMAAEAGNMMAALYVQAVAVIGYVMLRCIDAASRR